MEPLTLEISGRIYRDPESESGMYVSVIDAWGISTCGRTPEEAMQMTSRLIHDHLEAARQLGVLERELAKIGVIRASPPARMHVRTRFQVDTEADISLH